MSIVNYIRLVASQINVNHPQFTVDELTQVGVEAALLYWHKYDQSKGTLTTYFGDVVRHAMLTYAHQTLVRVPPTSARKRGLREITAKAIDTASCGYGELKDASGRTPEPWEIVAEQEDRSNAARLVKGLPPREREVLLRRCQGEKLADIGRDLGMCGERVRQIYATTIRDLQERLEAM